MWYNIYIDIYNMAKIKLKYINKENLKIARENIGYSLEEAQKIFDKNKKDTIKRFESGEEIPTYSQLKKLSTIYNIASILLLSENNIKIQNNKLKDFRKNESHKNNINLKKTIYELNLRQKNIERFFKQDGIAPNNIIGNGINKSTPKDLASHIIKVLKINIKDFQNQEDSYKGENKALKYLIEKIEEHNIFVNKTFSYWGIEIDEMKGLCLYNEYAPFILLNRKDYKNSQIFTLCHELAHIFRKTSAISDLEVSYRDGDADSEEIFCNKVATEILLPESLFTENKYDEDYIKNNSIKYKVSPFTLLYRLSQLKKLNGNLKEIENNFKKSIFDNNKKTTSGGNYNTNMSDSNGKLYSKIIYSLYLEERIGYVEAKNLLRMDPEKYDDK